MREWGLSCMTLWCDPGAPSLCLRSIVHCRFESMLAMKEESELEENPFTSSLNISLQACCRTGGGGPSNASPTHPPPQVHNPISQLICEYSRRRNRYSPHRVFRFDACSWWVGWLTHPWLCVSARLVLGFLLQNWHRGHIRVHTSIRVHISHKLTFLYLQEKRQ